MKISSFIFLIILIQNFGCNQKRHSKTNNESSIFQFEDFSEIKEKLSGYWCFENIEGYRDTTFFNSKYKVINKTDTLIYFVVKKYKDTNLKIDLEIPIENSGEYLIIYLKNNTFLDYEYITSIEFEENKLMCYFMSSNGQTYQLQKIK